MRTCAARSAENGDLSRIVQHPRSLLQGVRRRERVRGRVAKPKRERRRWTLAQGDIAREDHDGDSSPGDRRAHGNPEHAWHLFRLRDQLAVVAAILEQVLGMRLLEIAASELGTGDLSGDRKDRDAIPMAVVEAVDEVQIPRPATARADGNLPCEMSLGARREGRYLFVPDVQPLDALAPANDVRQSVERVADQAVDALHSGFDQSLDEHLADSSRHVVLELFMAVFRASSAAPARERLSRGGPPQ
jgi:hypothetical protein